jgi:hypothetical protein
VLRVLGGWNLEAECVLEGWNLEAEGACLGRADGGRRRGAAPARLLGPSGARRTGEWRTTRRSAAVLGCWLGCWAGPGRTAWLLGGAPVPRLLPAGRGWCRTVAAAPLPGAWADGSAAAVLPAGRCSAAAVLAARALRPRRSADVWNEWTTDGSS